MKIKLKIDTKKDTFKDIADRMNEYFKSIGSYKGTAKEVKYWLTNYFEPPLRSEDPEGVYVSILHDGISLKFNGVVVIYSFKVKDTGKTTKVSNLRRMKLYEFDKVVIKQAFIGIWYQDFKVGEEDYEVVKNGMWGHSEDIAIITGKELPEMTFNSARNKAITRFLDSKGESFREILIKNMAQPWLKQAHFRPLSQEEGLKAWANILKQVEIKNIGLLNEQLNSLNIDNNEK